MKIYTKSGDKGNTSIIGGQRIKKSDARICAYGSIDEVNSWIGRIISELDSKKFDLLKNELIQLQVLLFDIGTDLATPVGVGEMIVKKEDVTKIEHLIDYYQTKVPIIEKFILPGGHPVASDFQIARTVIRRAEREITQLLVLDEAINIYAYKIINRLSDLFFVLSRYVNTVYDIKESFYERAGKVFH
ncbi:cob(I)yrinic acid a,c-diamide adenosyltransferase [Enterococcus dongliensis]|uniref:cob(I)yrinic acid a,c-diamide adenosyltransferase n=1 Tax=Enterococcus dongliensis TaxID=2559925 RepID=UPI002891B781|nr:cob(I)yrinic acid a,c-diamide adenosyltransferase [Enterococcus dongliensis]MDT2674977.1 cob(I)yrinic acid a,c-diamide adenosyltransferase [Enterococcus dongliensis]